VKLEAKEMRSSVLLNNRNGTFTLKPLPTEAQFSTVSGIAVSDYDGDGKQDILLGGNFYQSKPEVGIYDASYGLLLKGDGKGNFKAMHANKSGFFLKGAVRDIITIKSKKKDLVIVARNNDQPKIFQ
ncbi:VCBS repeat-containing protein, partial [Ferruginibacter sp.]|uniref:FG-GAP repeat domain-containing protein n=1 Tax=Ferruginibacter sp. TaxID=1940288 RepID=UPI0019979411